MEAFSMEYHVYRKTWKPFVGGKFRNSDGAEQPNGKLRCCCFSSAAETCCGSPALWTF